MQRVKTQFEFIDSLMNELFEQFNGIQEDEEVFADICAAISAVRQCEENK